jgi:AhpD family alkylhydroperoxidase
MSQRLNYNQIAPNGAKALGSVYGYVMQSGLPGELVELVYLRVSQINNCAYCLDMHTRDLIKKGVKVEKLALVQAWSDTEESAPSVNPPPRSCQSPFMASEAARMLPPKSG